LSAHSQITISEETYSLIADRVIARRIGAQSVRGREEPVVAYMIERLR